MTIIVTGGAGFIGSNFVLDWCQHHQELLINLDRLTYAGNLGNLRSVEKSSNYKFVKGDIGNTSLVTELFMQYRPRAIIHFAAESHVDRSIAGPDDFIQTNVVGTFRLLEACRLYWQQLAAELQDKFRFLHVSTDEVFGSLLPDAVPFTEKHQFQPNSPYSASKAASDHIVRAYFHTYGLPVLTTHCSNNYGPYQFPEKLIPLIIHNALNEKLLPVYGDGQQVRDWLYVLDHCRAISRVLDKGKLGETYNIGGLNERTNLRVVETVCNLLDELQPRSMGSYTELIDFVEDRPGHDQRYAIDASKIARDLDWRPEETFDSGIRKTVQWYLTNREWVQQVTDGSYRQWIEAQYS